MMRFDQLNLNNLDQKNDDIPGTITSRSEFDDVCQDFEARNQAITAFDIYLHTFLNDTKTALIKMVVCFDETESKRRQALGPVFEGTATEKMFTKLADEFSKGCTDLFKTVSDHWIKQSKLKVSNHQLKI